MDSQKENSTMSIPEAPLLHHNEPKQTKKKNLENILFITFLTLIILTTASITLISMSKTKKPKRLMNLHISNSNRNYCNLTFYPELCYESLTFIIDATVLQTNPTPIFTAAIQVAINQLNSITLSKTHDSLVNQPRLSDCQTWVHDSLSHLHESLRIIDSDIESLTYEEMDSMKARIMSAVRNASKCLLGLEEIGATETVGVEEVEGGVKKAMNFMVNSVGLLRGRHIILNDFYNRVIGYADDYYYDPIAYYQFDYGFLICLYCGLYLFLGLVYFLFWKSK